MPTLLNRLFSKELDRNILIYYAVCTLKMFSEKYFSERGDFMFIGREKELVQLNAELSDWKRRTAALIYGKRRVGKSTLIREAAKSFNGIVIYYVCVSSTFEGNLELINQSVSDALQLPGMRFNTLSDLMDYLDASKFYPRLSVRDRVAFYAVFGGSPYVLENLNKAQTLEENITHLLLKETGLVRSHIENVTMREIQKNFDARILEKIGNGKKRYTEIRDRIASNETGLLDKQLKILLDMETIQKTMPINRRSDKKKTVFQQEY